MKKDCFEVCLKSQNVNYSEKCLENWTALFVDVSCRHILSLKGVGCICDLQRNKFFSRHFCAAPIHLRGNCIRRPSADYFRPLPRPFPFRCPSGTKSTSAACSTGSTGSAPSAAPAPFRFFEGPAFGEAALKRKKLNQLICNSLKLMYTFLYRQRWLAGHQQTQVPRSAKNLLKLFTFNWSQFDRFFWGIQIKMLFHACEKVETLTNYNLIGGMYRPPIYIQPLRKNMDQSTKWIWRSWYSWLLVSDGRIMILSVQSFVIMNNLGNKWKRTTILATTSPPPPTFPRTLGIQTTSTLAATPKCWRILDSSVLGSLQALYL